ncbi:phosphopantetheine-binding protein [Plantactinospora sp. B6F1]|uniref:phosphopantetheine-binding protein n=1 Tax=Plantactinospora sp. B6F1 TaxID=3158971 RepID=UPI0010CEA4FE
MTTAVSRDQLGMSSPYVPPEDELEHRLAQLWGARLTVWPIGRHDDFFQLGGDSLLAAELQLDIDQALGVEADIATLFIAPTVAELADAVRELLPPSRAEVPAPISTIGDPPVPSTVGAGLPVSPVGEE